MKRGLQIGVVAAAASIGAGGLLVGVPRLGQIVYSANPITTSWDQTFYATVVHW